MELISVNVTLPREVAYRGKEVSTGIFKEPVESRVMLRTLNLDGDRQADLDNHGGPFRAAYVYTHENFVHWQDELRLEKIGFGKFGENFTVTGMPEDEVHIGDIFRVGGAIVQVTQPRGPCFKLGIRMGRPSFPKLFLASGRVGFYLRVLQEGEVGAGDMIERVETHPERMTVREVIHLLYFDPENREDSLRAAGLEALTPRWRDIFASRVA
ncbi:MAG: MOSC domain-containing protein [Chloroflexota bacterium]